MCIAMPAACLAMSATYIRDILLHFGGKFKSIGPFYNTNTAKVNIKTVQKPVKILHLRVPRNLYNQQPLCRIYTVKFFYNERKLIFAK